MLYIIYCIYIYIAVDIIPTRPRNFSLTSFDVGKAWPHHLVSPSSLPNPPAKSDLLTEEA